MSTNPNNAVGTNGAYSGRTSVYAFNDNLAAYSRGILSGWECSPNSGMTVSLGGNGTTRDVAIAEDNIGNKTTVNNISLSPISVTVSAAPSTNSRIDSIVAYVNNAPIGVSTVSDNPAACGLIVVKGTAAANPTAPNNSTIRTAITSDGGSGVTAYYVVLANITVPSGTTTLTSSNISAGNSAAIGTKQLSNASVTAPKIDFTSLVPSATGTELNTTIEYNGKTIYAQRFAGTFTTTTSSRLVIQLIGSGVSAVISYLGGWSPNGNKPNHPIGPMTAGVGGVSFDAFASLDTTSAGVMRLLINASAYNEQTGSYDIVVYYTKS